MFAFLWPPIVSMFKDGTGPVVPTQLSEAEKAVDAAAHRGVVHRHVIRMCISPPCWQGQERDEEVAGFREALDYLGTREYSREFADQESIAHFRAVIAKLLHKAK